MVTINVLNQTNSLGGLIEKKSVVKSVNDQKTIVSLDQSAKIQLGIKPDQIAKIERIGNNAVITLENGEVVTLENYFTLTGSQIVLEDATGSWQVNMTPSATGQITVDYLPIDTTVMPLASETGNLGLYAIGAVAFGGIVAAASQGGGGSGGSQAPQDTTAPDAGNLSFVKLQDTGASNSDRITSDRSFNLQLTGQETGSSVEYQMSIDGGKTWTVTTAQQSNLADGNYQFRVKVTDTAGNSSFSETTALTVDTTSPAVGQLTLSSYQDSGSVVTDHIGNDKSFDLTLKGAETGSQIEYQVSTDGGKSWTATTATQSNLTDGSYQFRAKVTDTAGNSSFSEVQAVTVDTIAPVAGNLSITGLADSGSSTTDHITQDDSFNLTLGNPEAGSSIGYEISTDGGKTWTATTAAQSNLAEGSYQFRAVITDSAGNSSISAVQAVTIDKQIDITKTVISINAITADNSIDLLEAENTQIISGSVSGLASDITQYNLMVEVGGKSYEASIDPATGQWSVEVAGNVLFSADQISAHLSLKDTAGNVAQVDVDKAYSTNPVPEAPTEILATVSGVGSLIITGTAFKGSTITIKDSQGNIIASGTTDDNGQFTVNGEPGLLQAGNSISVTATVNGHESNLSNPVIVSEVPFLQVMHISETGLIEGFTTSGSLIKVLDAQGQVIAEYKAPDNFDGALSSGSFDFHLFRFSLDQPLPEGTPVTVIAIKDGIESRPYPITADYTAPEPASELLFDQYGTTLTGIAEAGSYIQLSIIGTDDEQSTFLGSAQVDANGKFSISLTQPLHDGEKVQVIVYDKNQNKSGEAFISAPDYAPIPSIYRITKDGLISGMAEPDSIVTITDAKGNVIATGTTDSEGYFFIQSSQTLKNNQEIQVSAVNSKGQTSEQGHISVDYTAPAPATELTFDESGLAITGKAEPGSYASVILPEGYRINALVSIDGSFKINLYNQLHNGETVELIITDSNQNSSAPVKVTAPDYALPPQINAKVGLDNVINLLVDSNNTIVVRDEKGTILPYHLIDSVSYPYSSIHVDADLKDGQQLYITAINPHGHESKPTSVMVDHIAPETAQQISIDAQGHSVSGIAEANSTVSITDVNNQIVGIGHSDDTGHFVVELNDFFVRGEQLAVTVSDNAGNQSKSEPLVAPVDKTAPTAPTGLVMSESGQYLTGHAEANSYILVFNINGEQIGSGYSNSKGEFSAGLYDIYLNGQQLTITVTDQAGNRSKPASFTAPLDNTAPEAATGLSISEDGHYLTGQAESGSRIQLYDANHNPVGSSYVDSDGHFSAWLSKPYLNGETLTVTVIDPAGNISASTAITAPLDNIAPDAATHLKIQANGLVLTGQAEANSSIKVFDENGEEVPSYFDKVEVNPDGTFNFMFQQTHLKGQQLTVVVIDGAGNQSVAAHIKAPLDNIAPEVAKNLVISADGRYLEGNSEAFSTISVYDSQGHQVGGSYTQENGKFSIYLYNDVYLKGQSLSVIVTDVAGNKSKTATFTAPLDTTEPAAASQLKITEDGQYLTGNAEANMHIQVYDSKGHYIAETSVDANGHFSAYLYDTYLKGEVLTVKVADYAGNQSKGKKVTAPLDNIAPSAPMDLVIAEDGQQMSGHAEANSRISVYDQQGQLINSSEADSSGNFVVYLYDDIYLKGQKLTVIANDAAGNQSEAVKFSAPVDSIAPASPTELLISNDGRQLTGHGEAGSIIHVYTKAGDQIGEAVVDSSGNFSTYLYNDVYLKGQQLTVKAIDRVGNQGDSISLTAPLDSTAPKSATSLKFSQNGHKLTGIAEPGSKIQVLDAEGEPVYSYPEQVNADGSFTLIFSDYYLNGQQFKVVVTDAAGNQSKAVHIKAPIDTTAPDAASKLVLMGENYLQGYAEENTTIVIKDNAGHMLYTTETSSSGHFVADFGLNLFHGETITVTVVDHAGNASAAVNVMVPSSTVSPATSLAINEAGNLLTGHATPNSYIYVYDEAGNYIVYNAQVDSSGDFSVELDNYYIKGETFKVYVSQEPYGTFSNAATVTAPKDITPPAAPEGITVDSYSSYMTGKAEADSRIIIKDSDGFSLGEITTNQSGEFNGYINGYLLKGQQIFITATDRAGNQSQAATYTVATDKKAPSAAQHLDISSDGHVLSGTAAANSYIGIHDQQGFEVGWGMTDASGHFTIELNNYYVQGEKLRVVVQKNGHDSTPAAIIAPIDTTPPDAATGVKVTQDGLSVTGHAEANALVTVFNSDGYAIATGMSNASGKFIVNLNDYYLKGQILSVVVKDYADNQSPVINVTAPVDNTPPAAPEPISFNSHLDYLYVNAESGSQIIVKDDSGDELWFYSSSEVRPGEFEIYFYQPLQAESKVTLITVDHAGNQSAPVEITVVADITPPDVPVDLSFNTEYTILTGHAEAYSQIQLFDENGFEINTMDYTKADGSFSIDFAPDWYKGQSITVVATDRAGNSSLSTSILVPFDPVLVPTELAIVDDGISQIITGYAEAYSNIEVRTADNILVGDGYTDSQGSFAIYLYSDYLNGVELQVIVKNDIGNSSLPATITTPLDNIAPAAPSSLVIINDGWSDILLTGQTDSPGYIEIYNSANNLIGSADIGTEGNFEIYIPNYAYTEGDILTVKAIDRAGNVSDSSSITVPFSYISPAQPSNLMINDGGENELTLQIISGQSDPYNLIEIYSPDRTAVYSSYADDQGNFTVDLYGAYYKGEVFTVIATDSDGHVSSSATITAPFDVSAPNAPTDLILQDYSVLVGRAESNSFIQVFDEENNIVGNGYTDHDGNFEVALPYYDDAEDKLLTITVTDRAGNSSESSNFVVPALTDMTNKEIEVTEYSSEIYSLLLGAETSDTAALKADFASNPESDPQAIHIDELLTSQVDTAPEDIFAALGDSAVPDQRLSSNGSLLHALTTPERPDELFAHQPVLF
ncbi:Ig-like domain repeat protein [Alkanindiges illinoisensis]|uniref:Ig-like domain repeat protein n=1 Tax=Alkanindiges illinoisensis TaxID=197183 RepID=UPI000479C9FA|nr:Ig-like domain repeat protein [Alkanindiges illinoisensis]